MARLNWTVSKDDREAIFKIADRACDIARRQGSELKKLDVVMDITATHANGCALDLRGLLRAEPFDFTHDIAGIFRHLNRETGQLEDCFVPRYASRQTTGAAA